VLAKGILKMGSERVNTFVHSQDGTSEQKYVKLYLR
jgi:hypothetical protein